MADNPRPNRPASGAYGEAKEREDLEKALPSGPGSAGAPGPAAPPGGGPSGGPIPSQPRPVGRPPTPVGPPGVPAPILAPTDRPDLPLGTGQGPVLGNPAPMPQAADSPEYRLFILDALANSPVVSEETRQWAALVRDLLIDQDEL